MDENVSRADQTKCNEMQTGIKIDTVDNLKNKLKESVSSINGKKNLKGKPKPLYFWTSADVNKWLKKHGGVCYELYGDHLIENDVTGRCLIRLNEIKLEKMGITELSHRKELMQHILRLRLKHEVTDLKNLGQKGSGFELKLPETRIPPDKTEKAVEK